MPLLKCKSSKSTPVAVMQYVTNPETDDVDDGEDEGFEITM